MEDSFVKNYETSIYSAILFASFQFPNSKQIVFKAPKTGKMLSNLE